MEVMALLDALENILQNSSSIPLSGKHLVNKDELMEIINDIRVKIPDEVKQAQWIKEERQKILIEAKKEAESVRKECDERLQKIKDERQRILAEAEREAEILRQEADKRIHSLVDESEIVRKAQEQAKDIITAAQQDAKKIRLGSKVYADEILSELEKHTSTIMETIKSNRDELKNFKS